MWNDVDKWINKNTKWYNPYCCNGLEEQDRTTVFVDIVDKWRANRKAKENIKDEHGEISTNSVDKMWKSCGEILSYKQGVIWPNIKQNDVFEDFTIPINSIKLKQVRGINHEHQSHWGR